MRQGDYGERRTLSSAKRFMASVSPIGRKININSSTWPHLTLHTHLTFPLILLRSAGRPDQWLCHPLMVWHHSIALISEQRAGLTHSGARLQTLRRLLSFLMESGVHMCDCMWVCLTEERKSERLHHRKYWLCYLLQLTCGAKADKSIQ